MLYHFLMEIIVIIYQINSTWVANNKEHSEPFNLIKPMNFISFLST
jgi:hypothetical protein